MHAYINMQQFFIFVCFQFFTTFEIDVLYNKAKKITTIQFRKSGLNVSVDFQSTRLH